MFNRRQWDQLFHDIMTTIQKAMNELKKDNAFVSYGLQHRFVDEFKHDVSIGVVFVDKLGKHQKFAFDWKLEPNLYLAMDSHSLNSALEKAWITTRDQIYKLRMEL